MPKVDLISLTSQPEIWLIFIVILAILERVEAHEATPFRPFIGQRDCPPDVLDLMEKCWADNPEDRPAFVAIRSTMRGIMKYNNYLVI